MKLTEVLLLVIIIISFQNKVLAQISKGKLEAIPSDYYPASLRGAASGDKAIIILKNYWIGGSLKIHNESRISLSGNGYVNDQYIFSSDIKAIRIKNLFDPGTQFVKLIFLKNNDEDTTTFNGYIKSITDSTLQIDSYPFEPRNNIFTENDPLRIIENLHYSDIYQINTSVKTRNKNREVAPVLLGLLGTVLGIVLYNEPEIEDCKYVYNPAYSAYANVYGGAVYGISCGVVTGTAKIGSTLAQFGSGLMGLSIGTLFGLIISPKYKMVESSWTINRSKTNFDSFIHQMNGGLNNSSSDYPSTKKLIYQTSFVNDSTSSDATIKFINGDVLWVNIKAHSSNTLYTNQGNLKFTEISEITFPDRKQKMNLLYDRLEKNNIRIFFKP